MALFTGTHVLPLLECFAKACESRAPWFLIARKPRLQFAERFGTQRIEAVLPFRSDSYKPCLQQQPQMSRHTGLVNVEHVDDVIHLLLAAPQRLDDLPASLVSECLKSVHMHHDTYTR